MDNREQRLMNIIYARVEDEQRTINRCDEVDQELKRLNDGIQSCLEMASDSIGNLQIRSKIKALQDENNAKYKIASERILSDVKEHKDKLKELKQDAERISSNNRQKKV